MYYVVNGFILAMIAISLRAALFPDRKVTSCSYHFALKALAFFGVLFAGIGFSCLIQGGTPTAGADYSQLVVLLGLFAAAILIGFFGHKPAGTNAWSSTAVSVGFMGLLYLVFGAISYYIGVSAGLHHAPGVASLVPFVMWAILLVNMLRDFADFGVAE